MPFAAVAAAAIPAVIGGITSSNATDAQTEAANKNNALQEQIYQQTTRNEKPYLQAGNNSLAALLKGLGLAPGNAPGVKNGSLDAPFTFADYQKSPGYNFQMQQGTDAVLNNASHLGGVNSGNTLKALTQFGQGLASSDYQQAYNNYTNNQNNIFSRLYSLVGSGQNAASAQGGFGADFAGAVSGNNNAIGNANAAGSVALGNTIGNFFNNPSTQSAFQNMFGGTGGFNFGGQTAGSNYGGFAGGGIQL